MPTSFRFEIFAIVAVFALVTAFISENTFTTLDCLVNRVGGTTTAFCADKLRESFTLVTPKPKQELVETRASDTAAIFGARSEYLDGYIKDSAIGELQDERPEVGEVEADPLPEGRGIVGAAAPSLGSLGGDAAPPISPSPYDIATTRWIQAE